jgi:ADP-ribose pyrophosphatase YjhB (NUDIX family)
VSDRDIWPRILVSACVSDCLGRVLVTRHPPSMRWHLPDGDLRRGETIADAVRRSVKEDLGIAVWPEPEPFLVTETIAQYGAPHYVTLHVFARVSVEACARIVPAAGIEMRFLAEARAARESVLASSLAALRVRFGWRI